MHLAHFDETATTAAVDPDRFRAEADALVAHGDDFTEVVTQANRGRSPADLLAWLRTSRAEYLRVFGGLDPSTPLPWYGPPMSAASSVTARLMETWAHGQDVVDAVGATREPTARLRNIAHLGVATRGWSHRVHGEEPPADPVRVELTAPDGEVWTWGPADAVDRASSGRRWTSACWSPQRRHRADLGLRATARSPTTGSTSRRPSPARPDPGGPPHDPHPRAHRQLLRLLRRPAGRRPRDGRGRADRCPDR